jgi:hypothetical protein
MESHVNYNLRFMKYILPLIYLIVACNNLPAFEKKESQSQTAIQQKNKIPYSKLISNIDSLKKSCRSKSFEQSGVAFSTFIGEKIVPYWIGTPWDYNGITQTPNEGFIACGYLVTTILRDAGVAVNRVKMAQCASEQMITSLTTKKENYSRLPFVDFITKVKSKGIGLSIIGLDNHTGFLYHDGNELYFIHSSFVGEGRVAKEIAKENGILQGSHYKVVGFISRDEHFIKNWLK